MISEHSAHLVPLSVDLGGWLWRCTCLLLLISMLWHRQAIFKSKGDKLCSSAESRIWTRHPRHQFASRLNARWQTDWAIEDQTKKTWTRQPVPMISEHSAHLVPLSVDFRTWLWRYTCLLLLIPMLWHRQAIFKSKGDKLCSSAESRIWTRDPRHQFASRLNARWQIDWAIEDQVKKLELHSPSLWSASIQPTWSHCQLTFASGSGDIHVCCCWIRCSGTGKPYSNRKETSCVPLLEAGFEPETPNINSPADWMLADKSTELSRIKLKNLNSTARPYDQRAFNPLGPTVSWLSHLALAIYMFVVIDFDALAQASDIQNERRQVVFRCWKQDLNPRPRHRFPSRLNACWQTDWAMENQAKKNELDSQSLWSASIQPTWSHCQLTFAPGSGDIHVCCCWFRCSGTGKRYSNRKETSCVPLLKAGFEPDTPDTNSPADWMLADKPTELSRIKPTNLNSTARPYDQRAFSPLGTTVSWISHLALAIYMFVVVDFDVLAQASDIQIERRQVVFLCWKQVLNPRPETPIRQQTECSLTNRLSYRGSS